jgi:peptidyl-tRNA hydrolase
MNGVRGKFGAQAGHAYLHAFWDSEKHFPDYAEAYKDSERAFKICVSVPTDADLVSLQKKYASICGTSLTVDAGLTVFNEPTVTTLGIGPVPDSLVEDTLRDLKPLT